MNSRKKRYYLSDSVELSNIFLCNNSSEIQLQLLFDKKFYKCYLGQTENKKENLLLYFDRYV